MPSSSKRRPRGRFLRVLVFLGVLIFAAEAIWLLASYVALNTRWIQDRVNKHPEKLLIVWKKGWSWTPWSMRIEGIRIRGQGRRDQWYGEAGRADIALRPFHLMGRRIVSDKVQLHTVSFRIRPRVDAAPEAAEKAEAFPDIPGLPNPPHVSPEFPDTPKGRPWIIDLRSILIEDWQELWIKEHRLTGSGRIDAELWHATRGAFTTAVHRLTMDGSRWSTRGEDLLTDARIEVKGGLGPIFFKVHRGPALFEKLTASTRVRGAFPSLKPILETAGMGPPWSVDGAGDLEVETRMELGTLSATLPRFALQSARVHREDTGIATNVSLTAQATLDPIPTDQLTRTGLVLRTTVQADLNGDLLAATLYQPHLGSVQSIQLEGGGRVAARVRLNRGEFEPGTEMTLESDDLEVHLLKVTITGDTQLRVRAEPRPEGTVSIMDLAITGLQFRHQDDQAVAPESANLRIEAIAHDPNLLGGFQEVELDLKLGPLNLPDSRVLNAFLPLDAGMSFQSGGFHLAAEYNRARKGGGHGRIALGGDAIDFQLGPRHYTGRLQASADYSVSTNEWVHLDVGTLVVTNVSVSGVRNRRDDGWFARVGLDEGRVALDGSRTVEGDVALELLDIRPLLAILREDPESSSWARWVPNLKELRGTAALRMDTNALWIRDLALRAKATEVMAQLKLEGGRPDGALYVRYGLISAGFDFRPGSKGWTILGAKRGYFDILREMGIEPGPDPDELNVEIPAPARP